MKKHLFTGACFLVVFGWLAVRCAIYQNIVRNGTEILIPVFIHVPDEAAFPYKISLRYNNLIPAFRIGELTGVAVVRRENDGTVSFVRMQDKRPLRPKELLLRYRVDPSVGRHVDGDRAKINFAADTWPFYFREKWENFSRQMHDITVKYAVLRVDDKGRTSLRGFADKNGVRVEQSVF